MNIICVMRVFIGMISNHGKSTDRLMIEGLGKDAINRFRLELNKEHLNDTITEECANVTD